MRWLALLLVVGCGHGESIGPNACDHAGGSDSQCCSLTADCTQQFEFCLPPGGFLGCGTCNGEPETCTTDAECKPMGATLICQQRTCACDSQRDCVAGCTADADCADGQSCDVTTNRCGQTPCTTAAECPADFTCTANACIRKGCIDASDCDAFCVEGSCYQSAGECRAQPV